MSIGAALDRYRDWPPGFLRRGGGYLLDVLIEELERAGRTDPRAGIELLRYLLEQTVWRRGAGSLPDLERKDYGRYARIFRRAARHLRNVDVRPGRRRRALQVAERLLRGLPFLARGRRRVRRAMAFLPYCGWREFRDLADRVRGREGGAAGNEAALAADLDGLAERLERIYDVWPGCPAWAMKILSGSRSSEPGEGSPEDDDKGHRTRPAEWRRGLATVLFGEYCRSRLGRGRPDLVARLLMLADPQTERNDTAWAVTKRSQRYAKLRGEGAYAPRELFRLYRACHERLRRFPELTGRGQLAGGFGPGWDPREVRERQRAARNFMEDRLRFASKGREFALKGQKCEVSFKGPDLRWWKVLDPEALSVGDFWRRNRVRLSDMEPGPAADPSHAGPVGGA